LGHVASRPPINVAFEAGPNAANVFQPACTLCGDCCSGCNVGAKTTVQMSYLPDAVNHGAEVFTEVTARHVKKLGTSHGHTWQVFYVPTQDHREGFRQVERAISARIVVLAAGALGSTELLLRSREEGLAVSDRLGSR
ncbi:MAG TPA: GMC family oxidoreductase N-terminal domain-containing protein, partial [Hyphomicrobiaceae bacterium]|nr:GMC family oxidoreductase N-terminal domain-containing protein [Hyphomicrobiaceae bacterium]